MQHGAERRGVTRKLGGYPTIEHLPQLSGQRRHHGLLLTKTILQNFCGGSATPSLAYGR